MARTQQLELDLPVDLKAAAVSAPNAPALALGAKASSPASGAADKLATDKSAGLKRWGRKKGQAPDESLDRLVRDGHDLLADAAIEAAVQGSEALQLAQAQAGEVLPGAGQLADALSDGGMPLQLAQLELPTQPAAPGGAAGGGTASGGAGAMGGFGGLGGVFGAAAGLGLAAGGGGGGKSAGSASPVVLPAPTTAAPTPTAAASDVISLFSDSYTNVPVSSWDPQWGGQTGDLSDGRAIAGNNVKRVTQLNYQGVQIATMDGNVAVSGVLDVSAKGHLHIDFWLETAGSFTLKLVSKNGAAAAQEDGVQLAGVAGWNSVDINLAQFDLVDLSKVIQMVFVTGGASGTATRFHFDNVYFAGSYSAGLEGRLVNGYIQYAEVFQDNNGDGLLNNDKDNTVEPGEEPYALTDAYGRFNLVGQVAGGGPLIAKPTGRTMDQSTGLPVSNVFKAPAGASVISPLSTLLEAGSASGLTELQLKAAFGIDEDVDLLDFNPVQAIEDAAAAGNTQAARDAANLALKLKAVNVTVSNLMDVGSSLIQGAAPSATQSSAAVVSSLVNAVQTAAAGTTPLDLASDTAVEAILSRAATTAGVSAAALNAVIAGAADQLSAATNTLNQQSTVADATTALAALTTMAKVEKVVQSTLSDSVNAVAQTPADVANLTNLNLNQALAAAQLPVQGFETLEFGTASQGTLRGFLGATVTKEVLAGNTVVKVIKPAGSADQFNASHVNVSTGANGELKTVTPLDLLSQSKLGMWVNSAKAGTSVTIEVGDSDRGGHPKDLNFVAARAITTKAGWEYLSFDFDAPVQRFVAEGNPNGAVPKATPLRSGVTYDMVNVFFDLGQSKGSDQTYYFDKLGYYTETPGAAPAEIAIDFAPALPDAYSLAWWDEFGGEFVSGNSAAEKTAVGSQWFAETGRGPNGDGWGNNEQQSYTNSINNAYVQNGALHIVADKTGNSITSARLKSVPDVGPNAYVEVRAKLPVGQGAWPAAWLLGQGTWPATGEIDIVEWSSQYFEPNEVQAALHSTASSGDTINKREVALGTPVTEFHTYQVWWTEDSIRFGVDANSDNAYYTYTKPANATAANWPFTGPMDLILNLAIGGSLGGNNNVPAGNFNYEMVVDWVKVYQGYAPPANVKNTFGAGTGVTAFEGGQVTLLAANSADRPAGSSGSVMRFVKPNDGENVAQPWAGVTIATLTDSEFVITGGSKVSLRVWSPAAGKTVMLKLEDSSNSSHNVEISATTTVAQGWQTLVFDAGTVAGFDNSHVYNKASVFFDFMAAASGQTYYFDDLAFDKYLVNPSVIKDFTGYAGGTSFEGAVSSLKTTGTPAGSEGAVVEWSKPSGAQPWAGTTIETLTGAEFISESSPVLNLRVWSPASGKTVRLKLEDQRDPSKFLELDALTTAASDWQTLSFDYSGASGLNHAHNYDKASVFFDFLAPASGQTYYFDNLAYNLSYAPPANVKNTFGAGTGVAAFEGGQVTLLAANSPDRPTGSSGSVMRFVKPNDGENVAQPWAGVTIATLTDSEFVITGGSKVSLRVWSPAAGKTVMLKLEDSSNSSHNVEISATTTVAQGWQTLVFDAGTVAGFDNSHVYNKASVFFDFMAAAAGQTYYFDDLAFDKYLVSPSRVNTFSDASAYASKKFDFEGASSSVISSDAPAGSDGAVVKSIKTAGGQPYAGSVVDALSTGEYISSSAPVVNLRVWSPDAGKTVRMKLEDASAPGTKFVEADAITTVSGGWQTLSFDFSRAAGVNHAYSYNKALVFFDFMADAAGQIYYFDNLSHNPVAQVNSAVTFEANDTTGYLLGGEPWDFGGNVSSRVDMPVDLGDPAAGGAPDKVAKVTNGDEPWSGTTFLNLPNGELISAGNELVSMRVYAPESGKKVMLKLEDREFPEKFKEVAVSTSTVGWQTLNFDFSGADHSADYNKASIFFDFYSDATNSHPGKVYYFDDVQFGSLAVL